MADDVRERGRERGREGGGGRRARRTPAPFILLLLLLLFHTQGCFFLLRVIINSLDRHGG